MAFFGLVDYGAASSSDDEHKKEKAQDSEDESEEVHEQKEEYDHELMSLKTVAERRALLLQRAARKDAPPALPKPSLLPSAFEALNSQQKGVLPKHLDPEATRRIPGASLVGVKHVSHVEDEAGGDGGAKEGDVFARLAPQLKEERKRPAAVISAAPKRAKVADEEENIDAVALHMGASAAEVVDVKKKKGGAKPKTAEEYAAKGGALPRKSGKEKDKEKARRMKGQSTFDRWKSEEEFALRQNYDS